MYQEVILPQDHYQAGFIIGERSRRIMYDYVLNSEAWQTLKTWIGSERLQNMERTARSVFPQYVEELAGIADGCNLPFSQIFVWNCRGDLIPFGSEGCTTVYVPSPDGILLGHNEDGDPAFRDHCFISRSEPDGNNLGFISFTYPASINGHTFAVNSAGLTQLINNVRSLEYGDGVPRQILSRAVLDCRSLDEALSVLKGCERSGSFYHMLAQAGEKDVLSIEYTPDDVSIRPVQSAYGHANHFIHPRFRSARQRVTASSTARQLCIDELCRKLPTPPSLDDIRRMLFNTDNPDLPVYRMDPNDPDGENTFATALFLIKSNTIHCKLYSARDREQALPCKIVEKTD